MPTKKAPKHKPGTLRPEESNVNKEMGCEKDNELVGWSMDVLYHLWTLKCIISPFRNELFQKT